MARQGFPEALPCNVGEDKEGSSPRQRHPALPSHHSSLSYSCSRYEAPALDPDTHVHGPYPDNCC